MDDEVRLIQKGLLLHCNVDSKTSYIVLFITARNNSCGKVMFSQASVILSTGGGGGYTT